MALLTSDVILDEAMERYAVQSVIMQLADGRYDPQWENSPVKGDTIAIRLPIYATARRGERANPIAIDERLVNLTIPAAYGSDSLLTDRQLAMELNDFKEQVLEPHIDSVSSAVAKAACQTMAQGVSQFVGTPGVTPTVLDTYQSAHRILTQSGTPAGMGTRSMLVDANMDQYAVAAGRTFFNEQAGISEQWRTGSMAGRLGIYGGATWYMEQALYQQTVGALGGTPTVSSTANQSGNSIATTGWTASVTGVLNQGDKVAFAGCYMVHPVLGTTYQTDLAQFTVAQTVNSDSSGNCTIPLTEGIEFGTPYANVSALPAALAAVYVWGLTPTTTPSSSTIAGLTFTLGILMHKSALVYASPNLVLPNDVDKLSGRTRSKLMKIGMRVWRASDVMSGEVVTRLDMLCGHLVGQPRKACLICST
jgi:hypothetical protein